MIAINQDNLHLTPAGENTLVGGIPARWLRVLSARLPHTHLSFRIVQETFVGAYQILAFGASRFVWRVKEGVVNLISRMREVSIYKKPFICLFVQIKGFYLVWKKTNYSLPLNILSLPSKKNQINNKPPPTTTKLGIINTIPQININITYHIVARG